MMRFICSTINCSILPTFISTAEVIHINGKGKFEEEQEGESMEDRKKKKIGSRIDEREE